MLKIVENDIYLTRGDSATIQVTLTDESGRLYKMVEGDRAVFTVKKNVNDPYILFQKEVKDGQVEIAPEDTDDLPYGNYVYDCQLTTASRKVYTFVTPHLFRLAEEVSF